MIYRKLLWANLIAIVVFSIVGPVRAEFKPRLDLAASGSSSTVIINDRAVIRFSVGNGTLTAAQRAEITLGRLRALVDANVSATSIYAKGDNSQARIYSGETLICIATSADAKQSSTNPLALANSWVSNIRSSLMMPPISVSDKDIMVPLGETRKIQVGGAANGPIYARVDDITIATPTIGTDGRYILVGGQQVGDTSVTISVEGEQVTLPVHVRKYAGRAVKAVAEVTGNPCPTSAISYAVRQALVNTVILEPGARSEFGSVHCEAGDLARGAQRIVTADVRISGPDYITYTTKAQVEVRNIAIPKADVTQLFYSNDPESLQKYQVLFAGRLSENKPTRVLYHHQNAMGKKAHFLIDLINPSATAIKVRISRGISDPMVDTVVVGYKASLSFLKEDTNDVSVIETIPPESRLILVSDMLSTMETASGIMQITQMTGNDALVRIASNPPGLDDVAAGRVTVAPNPIILSMSEHVYPSPVIDVNTGYTVGKQWAFISIGKHALTDATAQKKLYGNYGVTYQINVKVENPTDKTKKVSVIFDPTAGLASGVFIIDGTFVATKYVKPPTEFSLASYNLKPGEVRNIRVVTVPVAGSNYPATLVVKS